MRNLTLALVLSVAPSAGLALANSVESDKDVGAVKEAGPRIEVMVFRPDGVKLVVIDAAGKVKMWDVSKLPGGGVEVKPRPKK